ncbi:MAG: hypothetical protein H6649_09635 [Caldilineae bacterium]|nr:hypothetical protein [Anaerolineae bacterium]MCB9154298.1 hypothetical protein [Caldilineae bacterium]
MSRFSLPRRRRQPTTWSLVTLVVIVLLLIAAPMSALAQEGDSPAVAPPYIVTLQPGESTEIPVYGFCLNYSLPFPNQLLDPTDLANEPLRNAAIYSLETGYVDTNTWDVQKAIWYLSDETRLEDQDYTIADEIIEHANSGVTPVDVVEGVPHMIDLINEGVLEAQVNDFVNIAEDLGSFFGGGTLVITNVSEEAQQFVVSYGTVGQDDSEGVNQNMLIFPSEPAPEQPTTMQETVTTEVPTTGALLPPAGFAALALIGVVVVLAGLAATRTRRRPTNAV